MFSCTFLDEIDSASPAIQIKLLRVLETGEFFRVGGEEMCKVDVRIIAATNADLALKVTENKFREDLFYRLDVASLHIPPLRERPDDLENFINFFLEKESVAKQIPIKPFSEEALNTIKEHDWPGNIRELSNTVAQALLLSKGPKIEVEDLPERIKRTLNNTKIKGESAVHNSEAAGQLFKSVPEVGVKLEELLEQYETTLFETINFRQGFDFEHFSRDLNCWRDEFLTRIIESAVDNTYGNQVKAADLLGITPRALRYHLQKGRRKNGTD